MHACACTFSVRSSSSAHAHKQRKAIHLSRHTPSQLKGSLQDNVPFSYMDVYRPNKGLGECCMCTNGHCQMVTMKPLQTPRLTR